MRPEGIELFAGAGGLALGLEQAGIRGLLFAEKDKDACATLRANRPGWRVAEGDVREMDFTPWRGKAEIVSGGAPCQPFSYAGKRRGLADTRGTLFAEFARALDEVRPEIFLFENVKGLLTHDGGRTYQTILAAFGELGYGTVHRVLNAAGYGVAQKRERLITVGVREGSGITFSFPESDGKALTLRDALRGVPDSPGASYSERKRAVMELVPPGGCWTDLPEDVAREYMGKSWTSAGGRRGIARRMAWDEPCLTLLTSPAQKQTERCHPDQTRPFTVREYARIQSFPDSWVFKGSLASQYRQIGNAVPVELARRLGKSIVEALGGAA